VLENLNVDARLRGIAPDPADLRFGARRIAIDTNAETIEPGEFDLEVLGVSLTAEARPFSYAGDMNLQASLRVLPFSLKDLMQRLGTEPPVTADPSALTEVAFSASAAIDETAARLTDLSLELDDTTMTGTLKLPLTEQGRIEFELAADSINVDAYMAPAGDTPEEETAAATDDIEIPVELIRSLEARGTVTLARATLAGMEFTDMQLGLDSAGGKLRLHPISASLFDGTYGGDVRIDASTGTPSVSVNEKLAGVSLTPLARALFEQENISGTINGSFVLSGRGQNLAAIRRDLDGNMAFELADGAWEGTDVWYQLRSARALFKKEQPPERRNPPRTEFSSVIASGTVTDGIFRNDDLLAELPFLQLTGNGTVNLVEAKVDYGLQARVLERPEFVSGASEAELKDFTEAVIPLRITGPLSSPSIRPDIDGMLRAEVKKAVEEKKDELRDRLMERLLGEDKNKATAEPQAAQGETGEEQTEEEQAEEEQDVEDQLKDSLRKLFDQ
jgi:AsmA protein